MFYQEPIIVDNKHFLGNELLAFAERIINDESEPDWKIELYSFISDLLREDRQIIQQTSGTTGDPKSILLNRQSMQNSAKMTLKHFELSAGESILLCLPVSYIAGKMMVVRALVGGLNLLPVEPSGHPTTGIYSKIHFAAMVPLQVHESLKHPETFRKIEKLIIGGGEISYDLRARIANLDDIEVYETFAMTESYSHFACRRINGSRVEEYFKALPGVRLDTDQRGCLKIDMPGITNGEITTNDLVEFFENSTFKWLGRIDHVIKSGGIKIIPEIVENKIRTVIKKELAIIGVPDEKLGQKLILVVESEPADASPEVWNKSLSVMLTKHEIPKEIHCISHLPRNKSMKIDRRQLAANLKF